MTNQGRSGPSFIVAIALALAAAGCMRDGDGREVSQKEIERQMNRPVPVEVAKIGTGPIERVLEISSYLEAEAAVQVVSRTTSRLIKLMVEEGDQVEKDQRLARLEDDVQSIRVAKAEVDRKKAFDEFEREKALHEQHLVSDQAFSDAQSQLRQLELGLEDAKRELSYTEIKAPIRGTVTVRLVKYGDEVSPGEHLFDIVDFNSIVARAFIPEQELTAIKLGQPVRVNTTAFGARSFTGRVLRISPIVESKTGMVKITIGFDHIGPLRPGMYLHGQIVVDTKPDAVLVPKRAVAYDGDQRFIFRLKDDRRVERILLHPGLEDDHFVEPQAGIKKGDRVVIAGQTGLRDGARVRLPGDPDPEKENDQSAGRFSRLVRQGE